MTLHELANKACEELPDGWIISVFMEKGSGYVSLSHNGIDVEVPGYDTDGLDDQVRTAIQIAKEGK